jgi:hypothetical protein
MEHIKGGKAEGLSLNDIAKKHNVPVNDIKRAIKQGSKVEKEHTSKNNIAREIAKDHTVESPKYYKELAKMEKKIETKESTCANASGSIEGPSNIPIIKRSIIKNLHNYKSKQKQDIDEVTDASVSASGAYDAPFAGTGKNKLGIGGPESINKSLAVKKPGFPKFGGPGGVFIKIKEKCKTFPYCNQGDINNIEILKESINDVAIKYKLPISEVEKIVINEINKIFIENEK